jgi:hypothetical protein
MEFEESRSSYETELTVIEILDCKESSAQESSYK